MTTFLGKNERPLGLGYIILSLYRLFQTHREKHDICTFIRDVSYMVKSFSFFVAVVMNCFHIMLRGYSPTISILRRWFSPPLKVSISPVPNFRSRFSRTGSVGNKNSVSSFCLKNMSTSSFWPWNMRIHCFGDHLIFIWSSVLFQCPNFPPSVFHNSPKLVCSNAVFIMLGSIS